MYKVKKELPSSISRTILTYDDASGPVHVVLRQGQPFRAALFFGWFWQGCSRDGSYYRFQCAKGFV